MLRISVLGAAAPMDVALNGEPVVKGFRLPADEVSGTVREYTLTVPGAVLRPGVNILEIRNADEEDDGVLRLGTVTVESAEHDDRARRQSGDGAGDQSVWTFATEHCPLGATTWQPAPDLLFRLDRSESSHDVGKREPATRLAWRETTGAESSIAFRSDMSGFHGHFRSAGGSVGEVRGTRTGQLPHPEGAGSAGVRHFTTEESHDGVWAPAGRLRLVLDSGGAPVERVTWSDRLGDTTSLSLLTAAASGSGPAADERRDITDRVSRVRASDEFTAFGEVAENQLRDSSKWLAHESDPELHFTFDGPVAVSGYNLTSANDVPERDPSDWVLEGSFDGRDWTSLDGRRNEVFPGRHQTREFEVTHPRAYPHYRLRITANRGEDETQLSRVRFFDGGAASPDPGACDFVGYRQSAGAEPVGYRGTRIPAPLSGAEEDGHGNGELLAGDFANTARSLQDAARLLTQLTQYLRN
ncbi:alpha-1,2-mannosidase [Streptomyces sp. PSRA5]|uniref:alpha-1,2-mannosidase n=1 Tax=Streptomyces panacea TaxID=3035064 RepID=UPI00339C4932